jgi:hypothetical protein
MGPAPAKLRGQNPEALVSAFVESIGRKSFRSLRPRSKGITSRLAGRWPFLPLSLECKSKSFATLNLLWGPTYFKAQSAEVVVISLRTHSENRLFVWDFPGRG